MAQANMPYHHLIRTQSTAPLPTNSVIPKPGIKHYGTTATSLNHRNGMRWHKHKATNCKSRLRHVQSNASPPAANLAHDESPNKEPSADQPVSTNDGNDITSLLASTLNMRDGNPEYQEKIAMDLSAANLMWLLSHGLNEIAPVIYIYLLFTFPWPVLFLKSHSFLFVSYIPSLRKES